MHCTHKFVSSDGTEDRQARTCVATSELYDTLTRAWHQEALSLSILNDLSRNAILLAAKQLINATHGQAYNHLNTRPVARIEEVAFSHDGALADAHFCCIAAKLHEGRVPNRLSIMINKIATISIFPLAYLHH